jgi:hypothetical protein
MFVTQTCKRRMDRSNRQFETKPLQRKHLRIAKRLRNDGIARVKITEPHSLQLRIADCRLQIDVAQAETEFCLRYWKLSVER